MKSTLLLSIPILLTATFSVVWSKSDSSTYPGHLTGTFTGGFGEKTCHSCHFDYNLNWEEGNLSITGIPEIVKPGLSYEFEISVERENLGKAGFQLSSRFKNGTQAGSFQIKENERIMFSQMVPDSLQYIQHSPKGTEILTDNSARWIVRWKAPNSISDSIIFNITANAANGDESEFGDWIYVKEIVR